MSDLSKEQKATKILVADDEPNIVELLKVELESNGYQVITATGGEECFEKILKEEPDLVILDVRMPDLSGSEVALRLKDHQKFADLPLIFLTGLLSKDDEAKTGNEIANHVIFAKPLRLAKLTEKIHELLLNRDEQRIRKRVFKNP